jgi:pimeloyl-ACP methyl ester carboxylesterase
MSYPKSQSRRSWSKGDNDEYGTWEQVTTIERAVVGQVATVRVPACRHSPHVDQRERTLEAMASFAKAHS